MRNSPTFRFILCVAAFLLLAILPSTWQARAADKSRAISIILKPNGANPAPDSVVVTTRMSGFSAGPDKPFLQVPIVIASIRAQVYRDGDVVAGDASGPLPLRITEDLSDTSGFGQTRLFTALRATKGDITLTYRASITPAMSPRRLGPSYDLRGIDGAFAGAGASFLILPRDDRTSHLVLNWDLSEMAPGASGVSTLGMNNVEADAPPSTLLTVFIMVGKLHRYPENAGNLPFNAFWIGTPNYDAPAAIAWAAKSYQALKEFFRQPNQKPYYLLGRPHPNARDGGAATENGFMIEYGTAGRTPAAMNFMFTHEMVHHFIGSLDGPPGTSSWFGEGLAEFYKIRVPIRSGLIDLDSYETEVGSMTGAYYSNPRNRLPNDKIAAEYWRDSLVEGLPYNRGFMYFVNLDARVRAASKGSRSLDDLVLTMLDSRRQGKGYNEETWRSLVRTELGDGGIRDFDAMLAGELIIPPSSAFGDCLERQTRTITQRWLGFADRSLLNEPLTVTGLDPGSAAARAGLREGDRIVRFEGATPSNIHSTASFNLGPVLAIYVQRDDKVIPVRFDSAAGETTEYVWTRKREAGSCEV